MKAPKVPLDRLFHKYLADSCSEEEVKMLLQHFKAGEKEEELRSLILDELRQLDVTFSNVPEVDERLERIYNNINLHIHSEKDTGIPNRTIIWKAIALAATVIMVLGMGLFFYQRTETKTIAGVEMRNDIAPGGIGATLTLADGKKIALSGNTMGDIAIEPGVKIFRKNADELTYMVTGNASTMPDQLNTLSTGKGEIFTLVLSDGSKIWLNAASSVTFPIAFAGAKQRKVKLAGEAYFEIAKDREHPFIVESEGQQTEVLGTHFNINSYIGEGASTTTLLEGSLRVHKYPAGIKDSEILKPGETSVLVTGKPIKISPADTWETMAWKDGFFRFDQLPITTVMEQLARWYEVDVYYEGKMPEEKFSGAIARDKKISEVLNMLSYSGAIGFKIEGRRVTVMR